MVAFDVEGALRRILSTVGERDELRIGTRVSGALCVKQFSCEELGRLPEAGAEVPNGGKTHPEATSVARAPAAIVTFTHCSRPCMWADVGTELGPNLTYS